jgi:chromosome segregation ATPase
MDSDEKDKAIEHLRSELNRHKKMLSEVIEAKHRWKKQQAEYGERYTRLHNENQKLKATIKKLMGDPLLPSAAKSMPARRRWKGREPGSDDAEMAA